MSKPFINPAPGFVVGNRWGYREAIPGVTSNTFHGGQVFYPEPGKSRNVVAAGAGTVVGVRTGWGTNAMRTTGLVSYSTGSGNYVLVQTSGSTWTGYVHLATAAVKVGDRVKQGQVLGVAGTTGMSTGVHLHFDVFFTNPNLGNAAFNARVNPLLYIDLSASADKAASDSVNIKSKERKMPMILQVESKFYLVGDTGRVHIKNTNHLAQLRAGLKAWENALKSGKTEFSLGKYNGATMLSYLGKL